MIPRWYVAKTKPRQETVAMENLARQNFETYAPKISIERIKQKRIITVRELFFPGYVLVRFILENSNWRAINSTRGIISLLVFGENNSPCPMPTNEVENMQRAEIAGQLFISEIAEVHRGDRVRLKYGMAADSIGTVVFTRGERIELLLNLLGRKTRVKAPLHAVEVVGPNRNRLMMRRPVR